MESNPLPDIDTSLLAALGVNYPYPGLRPFSQEESLIFFGRQKQIDQMLMKLHDCCFLGIIGLSGCGKSSLVRAGLLPSLEAGRVKGHVRWFIADMKPRNQPFEQLACALLSSGVLNGLRKMLPSDPNLAKAMVEASLHGGPRSVLEIWKQSSESPDGSLLILVDQFEEIFRFREHQDSNAALAFVELLLESAQQSERPIYVVLTMRSDFLGDCIVFPGLLEALNQGQFLTPRLSREQCRLAIEGPASVFGAHIDPALVNRILNDIGNDPNKLPLMQHALMRTFEIAHFDESLIKTIELRHYKAIGGMESVLSKHADEIFAELKNRRPAYGEYTRRLFKALSETDLRGRINRNPIPFQDALRITRSDPYSLKTIIDAFRAPGRSFLTPSYEEDIEAETIIDISHESLLRSWKQLKIWIEEEQEAAGFYRRLAEAAALQSDRKRSWARDLELEQFLFWQEATKPTEAWADRYNPFFPDDPHYKNAFERSLRFLAYSQDAWMEEQQAQQEQDAELQNTKLEAAKKKQQKTFFQSIATVSILAVLVSLYFVYSAIGARNEADDSREKAESALREADAARKQAEVAYREADAARVQAESSLLKYNILSQEGEWIEKLSARNPANKKSIEERLLELHPHAEVYYQSRRAYILSAFAQSLGKENLSLALPIAYKAFTLDPNPITANVFDQLELAIRETVASTEFTDHQDDVRSVAFSPDGTHLLTGSDDSTVKLRDLSGKVLKTYTSYPGQVYAVAFSRDGKNLLIGGVDNTIQLLDLEGQVLQIFHGHRGSIASLQFSPDDQTILSASRDNTAKLWDLSGNVLQTFEGHNDAVEVATFSPDGTQILTGSEDKTAKLWSRDGLVLQTFIGHQGQILSAAFSPDNTKIVTGSYDGTANLWDINGTLLVTFVGNAGGVFSVAFGPTLPYILTGSEDGKIRLWNLDGTLKDTLVGHSETVLSQAFSPQGNFVMSGSQDDTVRLWMLHPFAVSQKKLLAFLKFSLAQKIKYETFELEEVLVSDDVDAIHKAALYYQRKNLDTDRPYLQTLFFSYAQKVYQHLLKTLQTIPKLQEAVTAYDRANRFETGRSRRAFELVKDDYVVDLSQTRYWQGVKNSATADRVNCEDAYYKRELDACFEWVLANNADWLKELAPSNLEEVVQQLSVVSDAEYRRLRNTFSLVAKARKLARSDTVAAMYTAAKAISLDSNSITQQTFDEILNYFVTGSVSKVVATHERSIRALAFSPDGSKILTGSVDKTAKLWDLRGNLLKTFPFNSEIYALDFSPDGKKILVGSRFGQPRILDLKGNIQQSFHTADPPTSAVQFSPDGLTVLTGGGLDGAKLWDLQGMLLQTFASNQGRIHSVAFSPDGKKILIGSKENVAELWNLRGRRLKTFRGHTDSVLAAAFSPDGKQIVTGGEDHQVKLWNVNGKLLQTLKGHLFSITSVSFSSDGSQLFSGSMDVSAKLWSRDGKLLKTLTKHRSFIRAAIFSPDGKFLLTGSSDNTARLWIADSSRFDEHDLVRFSDLSIERKRYHDLIELDEILESRSILFLQQGAAYFLQKHLDTNAPNRRKNYFASAESAYLQLIRLLEQQPEGLKTGAIHNKEGLETGAIHNKEGLERSWTHQPGERQSREPNEPLARAYAHLGLLYLANHQFDQARTAAQEGMQREPGQKPLNYSVNALSYLFESKVEEAKEAYLYWEQTIGDYPSVFSEHLHQLMQGGVHVKDLPNYAGVPYSALQEILGWLEMER